MHERLRLRGTVKAAGKRYAGLRTFSGREDVMKKHKLVVIAIAAAAVLAYFLFSGGSTKMPLKGGETPGS